MSELNTLFPDSTVTLSTGEVIQIKPFKFGQLPQAMFLAKGIFAHLQSLYIGNRVTEDAELIGELLSHGGEQFLQLICLSCNKPRTWFDDMEAIDGLNVAVKFLEVNVSFFVQKLAPELKVAKEKLAQVIGATSS